MDTATEKNIWGINIPLSILDRDTVNYLRNLPQDRPAQEWLLQEMDKIWYSYKLDNMKPLFSQPLDNFYSHPVWLVNGIFSAVDPVSASHRIAIAKYIKGNDIKKIADYGGGFGELALQILKYNFQAKVSIIEPYPSEVGKYRVSKINNISFSAKLENDYHAIIVQDVLEHVDQPIDLAYKIANAAKDGGVLIFANCFQPIIQCHLPSTFHLRHTFSFVMEAMGLKYIGRVNNCQYAQVFRKTDRPLDLPRAKKAERVSKIIGPILNKSRSFLSRVKHIVIDENCSFK